MTHDSAYKTAERFRIKAPLMGRGPPNRNCTFSFRELNVTQNLCIYVHFYVQSFNTFDLRKKITTDLKVFGGVALFGFDLLPATAVKIAKLHLRDRKL